MTKGFAKSVEQASFQSAWSATQKRLAQAVLHSLLTIKVNQLAQGQSEKYFAL